MIQVRLKRTEIDKSNLNVWEKLFVDKYGEQNCFYLYLIEDLPKISKILHKHWETLDEEFILMMLKRHFDVMKRDDGRVLCTIVVDDSFPHILTEIFEMSNDKEFSESLYLSVPYTCFR